MGRSAADFLVVDPAGADTLRHTPTEIGDEVAATLSVAGATASAALEAAGAKSGDTVLIGGAVGGVGVIAVQLAGARVIGTASEGTFDFLRQFGATPVWPRPGGRCSRHRPRWDQRGGRPVRHGSGRGGARARRCCGKDLHDRGPQPARGRAGDRRQERAAGRPQAHH